MVLPVLAFCWLWMVSPSAVPESRVISLDPVRLAEVMQLEFCDRVAAIHRGDREIDADYMSQEGARLVARHLDGLRDPGQRLREMLGTESSDPDIGAFQAKARQFAEAMAIEVFDSLQGEIDRVSRLRDRLATFARKAPALGPEDRLALLDELELGGRVIRRLAAGAETLSQAGKKTAPFERYATLRSRLLRLPVHRGLEVVFALGSRHESTYPFIDLFLDNLEKECRKLIDESCEALSLLP